MRINIVVKNREKFNALMRNISLMCMTFVFSFVVVGLFIDGAEFFNNTTIGVFVYTITIMALVVGFIGIKRVILNENN